MRTPSPAAVALAAMLGVAGTFACRDGGTGDARVEGERLLLSGDADGAVRALRGGAQAGEGEAAAGLLLLAARVERETLRRPEDAARTCRDAVQRAPGTEAAARALFLLGDLLEKDLLRPRKAIEAYRMVVADPVSPHRDEASYRIGRCYRALLDLGQARVEWQTLTAEGGGGAWRVPALLGIAEAEEAAGRAEEALGAWRAARDEAGDGEAGWRCREGVARALEALGQVEEARAAWETMAAAGHPEPSRVQRRIERLEERAARREAE